MAVGKCKSINICGSCSPHCSLMFYFTFTCQWAGSFLQWSVSGHWGSIFLINSTTLCRTSRCKLIAKYMLKYVFKQIMQITDIRCNGQYVCLSIKLFHISKWLPFKVSIRQMFKRASSHLSKKKIKCCASNPFKKTRKSNNNKSKNVEGVEAH